MVKLRIDNKSFEAPEGSTILDIARREGFSIPTLCYKNGMPHYSSCMVCIVKDNKKNSFIPSCSALVRDGMDIDASGEEVMALRQKALELLLSEHRAECEAPCRIVCPAGYNIPLLNRLIASNDFDDAIKLTEAEVDTPELACFNCKGYCENACRRKKIDLPVSIKNIKIFIYQNIKQKSNFDEKPKRRFNSLIGRLEPSEQQEWLKECKEGLNRFREISDNQTASEEAQNCMHCDCRAADNCELRALAESYSVKDPRPKLVNSPIVKKINHTTGLVFESAKCIKCGLCVRLCESIPDDPGLCFLDKGFVSIISEPLAVEFDDILKTRSKEVVAICPTGALSEKKDGMRHSACGVRQ